MQSWIHVIEWRATTRPGLTALADDRGAALTYAQLKAETESKAGGWAGLAVIGVPDERWGEAVHAVVVPAPGAETGGDMIIAWCRGELAHFKCPRRVEFAAELPRTTTGKVLKRDLRARLAAEAAS